LSILIVILLKKVEEEISVENILDEQVPRQVIDVRGLPKGDVEQSGEARVSDQQKDGNVEFRLPPRVHVDDYSLLEWLFLGLLLILLVALFIRLCLLLGLHLLGRFLITPDNLLRASEDLSAGPNTIYSPIDSILKLLQLQFLSKLSSLFLLPLFQS
jgi:hypothetical protein